MKEIPTYPCATCPEFDQVVCSHCQKAEQYITEIGKIATKYNANAAMWADKIARAKGEIARKNLEIANYEKLYNKTKGC